jgi:hypothetical protein
MEAFLNKYGVKKTENVQLKEGDQLFTFGKHKQKSYDWVWENDKPYVAWLLGTKDLKYVKKPYDYFVFKVETEIEL